MAYVSKVNRNQLKRTRRDYNNAIKGINNSYAQSLNDAANRLQNQGAFEYSYMDDPVYQDIRKQYAVNGQNSVAQTIAASQALSGGYGNSYASKAATQMNDQYLDTVNDNIPALMNAAYTRYQGDRNNLYNQLDMYNNLAQAEYNQQQQAIENAYNARERAQKAADDERDFNYNIELQAMMEAYAKAHPSGGGGGRLRSSSKSKTTDTAGEEPLTENTSTGGTLTDTIRPQDYDKIRGPINASGFDTNAMMHSPDQKLATVGYSDAEINKAYRDYIQQELDSGTSPTKLMNFIAQEYRQGNMDQIMYRLLKSELQEIFEGAK